MSDAAPVTRRSVKGWLIAVVAAVAALGLVAAFGGFNRREVRWITVAPGVEVDAGNLIFSFDSATAQYSPTASSRQWRVVVSGTVRNPHEETLRPLTLDYGNLVAHAPGAEPETRSDWYPRLGPARADSTVNFRQFVPPNNQPMTLEAVFEFDRFTPGDGFEVGIFPMEYTPTMILGLNPDPEWNIDSYALPSVVTVPLTRLPDNI